MAHSLFKMVAHIVFSTKSREPLILPSIENRLFAYISGIVKNNESKLIIAGGTSDHVHLLVSIGKKADVPKMIGDIKRSSSVWIKGEGTEFEKFYWQKGYGAFSVGLAQVEIVREYIRNQNEHHKSWDFKTEFRMMLDKYDIEYDERYVWD